MGDMNGGDCSLKNITFNQQSCDFNGKVCSGYVFKNSHTLSPYENLISFNNIDYDVEQDDADVSSGIDILL